MHAGAIRIRYKLQTIEMSISLKVFVFLTGVEELSNLTKSESKTCEGTRLILF